MNDVLQLMMGLGRRLQINNHALTINTIALVSSRVTAIPCTHTELPRLPHPVVRYLLSWILRQAPVFVDLVKGAMWHRQGLRMLQTQRVRQMACIVRIPCE